MQNFKQDCCPSQTIPGILELLLDIKIPPNPNANLHHNNTVTVKFAKISEVWRILTNKDFESNLVWLRI